MSKGSRRRPQAIPDDKMQAKWDKIFKPREKQMLDELKAVEEEVLGERDRSKRG